jgi:chemotaxis protein methyltransferase CheR
LSGGDSAAIEQLAALVRERTGNVIPAARLSFLGEIAERRSRAAGLDHTADYVRALAAGELPGEWRSLVPLLTIKESYFFRAPQQFEAIERQVLPRLLRARAASRRLRIWSAACARGEEPATLAMVLAEAPQLAGWDWQILATDLDEEALAGARRGLYGERAVSLVPPPLLERHFIRRGKLFELAPALRSRIDYRHLNLAAPPYLLPGEVVDAEDAANAGTEHDLILLRNVLIYFPRDLQIWVMTHVSRVLSRRGMLFLGASETLWQIQDELEAVDLGTCYAYQHRRSRSAAGGAAEPGTHQAGLVSRLPAGTPTAAAEGGFVQVAQAAQAAPAAPVRETAARPGAAAMPPVREPLPNATLRRGRRGESRGAVEAGADFAMGTGAAGGAAGGSSPATAPPGTAAPAMPPPTAPLGTGQAALAAPPAPADGPPRQRSTAELLLGAAHALAANRLAAAREAVDEALAAAPSEPAVHTLDGFLHDLAGRGEEAASSYRAALYLDPALFQPRLLLADCLLRLGRRERAGHEFREVLATLEAGRERSLSIFDELPLPDRERALRRCRQALQGG